jgi:S1-C subfamily serine protease
VSRSINSLVAVAALTALASFASFADAPAALAQGASAPAGWGGLSDIQNAVGGAGSTAKLAYPVIASVDPGSPAKTAGLVAGDTILAYNDVDAKSDPLAVKRFLKPGEQLVVKIRRNGVRDLSLTVAKRTGSNPFNQTIRVSTSESALMPLSAGASEGPIAIAAPAARGQDAPFAGAYLARLNAGLANALNVRLPGVLVVDVGNGSAAMKSGLRAGDVITRADSIAVETPLGIMTALRLAAGHSITLNVTRLGKSQKLRIDW